MIFVATILACSAPVLEADPTALNHVPAVVLLAEIDGDGNLSVGGTVQAELSVDLDQDTFEDTRYAFRYVVQAADGTALYARSTPGPVIVKDFLDYYGGQSNFDVLAMLPGLGQFPVQVPLIPGASRVSLQLRNGDGQYYEAGGYSLMDVQADDQGLSSVVTGWETLQENGPAENRLDIALVGDGYTSEEQEKWKSDAALFAAHLMETEPFADYAGLINIHRVDAVSVESGVSFDSAGGDCRLRDTAFRTVFALEAVNRFLGTDYRTTAVFQLDQWEVARAVSVLPWDMVVVVANTGHTGGFAVHYATVPNAADDWTDVGVHEFGHSMGLLGDEYTGDACIRSDSLGLPDNITDQGTHPPWTAWMDRDVPLPTPETREYDQDVGAFQGTWNCPDLYRPRQHCRMNNHADGFCPICTELLVRRLMRFADPLDAPVIVQDGSQWSVRFTSPVPAVSLTWKLDGKLLQKDQLSWEGSVRNGQVLTVEAEMLADEVRMDPTDLREQWRFVATIPVKE